MKVFILLLALCMLSSYTNEKTAVKVTPLTITVQELEDYLYGFFSGLHLAQFSDASQDCLENFDSFLEEVFDTYDDFYDENYYEFVLGIADSLGETSPLARNCSETTDQIITNVNNYVTAFDSFSSWIKHVEKTVWANFLEISYTGQDLYDELEKRHVNYTYVWEKIGEMVYYSIYTNHTTTLTYTQSDPLEPSPLNEKLWITLESIYEFLTASTLVVHDPISKCEVALVNMILYQTDSYNNFVAKNIEESVFLSLDSFVFLHDMVEQCYEAGQQLIVNGTEAYEFISTSPEKIVDNFKNNLFHVVSGSAATYAQIYHKDVISLFKVLGDVVSNTLIEQKE